MVVVSSNPFAPVRGHEIISRAIDESIDYRNGPPKKEKKKKSEGSEAKEQKKFVTWARSVGLEIAHLNNGSGSKLQRIRLAALGCSRGAADILVFDILPNDLTARGLALEFKSHTGKQSLAQENWQKRIEKMRWRYHIVRSVHEAVDLVHEYGLPM